MMKWDKVDKAYSFLCEKEKTGDSFALSGLANATGWKEASVRTYLAKRWHDFIFKSEGGKFKPKGILKFSAEEFRDLHSQKLNENLINANKTPKTDKDILIYKAREFALLAVAIYNNPTVNFKSYGFIVNIVIAWTALLHALFERDRVEYFYKEKDGKFKVVDGDKKAFELATCSETYWKGETNPVKANLEFLIGLRNKIEHRLLPELDFIVSGQCQSCLTNFENLLVKEFGDAYSLNTNLAISLQLNQASMKAQEKALRSFQSENYKVIREFIKDFQVGLTDDILTSQEYRLSVFLIPKLKNHAKASDLCVEFVKAGANTPEELEQYDKAIAFIKGNAELPYKLRPSVVVEKVSNKIGKKFTMSTHTQARNLYKARPRDKQPGFKGQYSGWVQGHEYYLYTEEWVSFLINELTDDEKYRTLLAYRA